jgi:WD40 repeat protein
MLARFDWPIPVEPEAAAAVFSPDGDRVAVVVGYTPSLYDLERGRALELEGHVDRVGTVAFSSDGRSIITSSADGTARVYRSDGTPRKTLAGHELSAGEEQGVTSAVFHPDGNLVLTTGADGTARLWDATTGVERNVLEAGGGVLDGAAFSPDGDLAAATDGSRVYVWSVASGESIAVVRGGSEVRALRFTPDGASLVAGERRRVRVTTCDGCGAVERLLELAHRRLDSDRDGTPPP